MNTGIEALALNARPGVFWLFASIAAMIAGAALWYGLRAFSWLRLVTDTPTSKIRSAAQGYVELFGFARASGAPLTAPLSGTTCVWYRYRIQERRGSGRDAHWATLEQGDAGQPFVLDDGSGHCLVDPTGASIRCRHRRIWEQTGPVALPAQGGRTRRGDARPAPMRRTIGTFMDLHRNALSVLTLGSQRNPPLLYRLRDLFGLAGHYRLTEERIVADDPVYLLGHFQTAHRDREQRAQLTRALLRHWKQQPERMRAFDHNGDGRVDAEEWEQARLLAERIAAQAEQRIAAQPALAWVGASSEPGQPFVISTEGEDSVIGRLRWQAFGGTALALILGIAVALAWRIRLGS